MLELDKHLILRLSFGNIASRIALLQCETCLLLSLVLLVRRLEFADDVVYVGLNDLDLVLHEELLDQFLEFPGLLFGQVLVVSR